MNSVEKYCRQVSRRLPARRDTRRRLLDGLAAEIDETLGGDCSMSEIIAAFGPPEQAAEELRQYIGPGEETRLRRFGQRSHLALVLLCVALVLIVFALVWYTVNSKVYITDGHIKYYSEEGVIVDETSYLPCTGGSADAFYGGLRAC